MKHSAADVIRLESESIKDLIENLDKNFDTAVKLILQCEGRVVVTGMGKSGLIGKKISATLASTGTPSFFMHPAEAIHGDLGMLKKEDILLALSNSGETDEIVKMLPFARKIGSRIICITGNKDSYLAVNSDSFLNSYVKKEAGIVGLAPTCSTTAQLVMGDALAITVSEAKSFEANDFASLHPGGTLGRKLLGSIKEVMITGESIPIVCMETMLFDAIKVITSKRLGFTVVKDRDDKLAGILTDGDLRRILLKNRNKDLNKVITKNVMIKDPCTVTPDTQIAEAIELMEQKGITSLVCVDEEKNIKGVAHLHDLLGRGNVKITI